MIYIYYLCLVDTVSKGSYWQEIKALGALPSQPSCHLYFVSIVVLYSLCPYDFHEQKRWRRVFWGNKYLKWIHKALHVNVSTFLCFLWDYQLLVKDVTAHP